MLTVDGQRMKFSEINACNVVIVELCSTVLLLLAYEIDEIDIQ